MSQKNKAEAEMENGAAASAGAFGVRTSKKRSSGLPSSSLGQARQTQITPQLSLTRTSYVSRPHESASATLSKIWVQQCQKNLGVQVGHNFLVQKNKDEGEIEQLAFNTVADLQKISHGAEGEERDGSSWAALRYSSGTAKPTVHRLATRISIAASPTPLWM